MAHFTLRRLIIPLIKINSTISLDNFNKVNYFRPTIDFTFKSLSEIYNQNLFAVLLSETNSDDADG